MNDNDSNDDGREQCEIALNQEADDRKKGGTSGPDRRPATPQNRQVTEDEGKNDAMESAGILKQSATKIPPKEADSSWTNQDDQRQPRPVAVPPLSTVREMDNSSLKLPPSSPPPKKRFRMPKANQGRTVAVGIHLNQRTRLLVFIKIILKCLDYEDPSLHLEAKQIVSDCTRKNRDGVPGYDSLSDAITRQLRVAVGEVHWNRAQNLMSHYMKSRSRRVTVERPKEQYAAV